MTPEPNCFKTTISQFVGLKRVIRRRTRGAKTPINGQSSYLQHSFRSQRTNCARGEYNEKKTSSKRDLIVTNNSSAVVRVFLFSSFSTVSTQTVNKVQTVRFYWPLTLLLHENDNAFLRQLMYLMHDDDDHGDVLSCQRTPRS